MKNKGQATSSTNDLAILRSTSGAIFGTFSLYSPINHKIDARAAGTVIKSKSLAICEIISK